MTRALVFQNAFFGAENEFSPDSLKDSFNCLDLGGHGVYPVFIRGERMENGFPWLPFGGRAATSAAANLRKIQPFPGIAMARQFVYFMQGLTKSYPTRKVLDNVHLSFYPDAKIGVLGVNGSGKSTLLKIMAGIDKEFAGEARAFTGEIDDFGPLEKERKKSIKKGLKVMCRETRMAVAAAQLAIADAGFAEKPMDPEMIWVTRPA